MFGREDPNRSPLRPHLTDPDLIHHVVSHLEEHAESRADLWRILVNRFAVDLDTAATVLPPPAEARQVHIRAA